MKRYIIRNCPAHFNNVEMLEFSEGDCNSDKVTKAYCKDVTDCVMKRIVDECNNAKQRAKDYSTNAYSGGMYNEANRILELLEIEEYE